MRVARPINNMNGVLLFDPDSKLTSQGIEGIQNFGLFGIFILEPAPPMTAADIEFEKFQTMCVFSIIEELEKITVTHIVAKIQMITGNIIKHYGHLDKKINIV